MIVDLWSNLPRYRDLAPALPSAIQFLQATDLTALPVGRHPINGEESYLLIFDYETKPPSTAIIEAHQRYLDIHFMIEGHETIGWALLEAQMATTPYNPDQDAAFYQTALDFVPLQPGRFCLVFPTDLHAPGLQSAGPLQVRKAVVKVRV